MLDLNQVAASVRPCQACQQKMYDGDRNFDKVHCENCTQWNMEGKHPLLKFDVPKDYPEESLTDEEKLSMKLSPRKISMSRLRFSICQAGKRLVEKTWNEAQTRSFMKIEGINEEWANKIVLFSHYLQMTFSENDYDGLDLTEEEKEWAEEQLLDATNPGFKMPEVWHDAST